ncbi:hypothetical protein [Pseudoxanthomonas mexicana]|uniref:hypothetical protein n=1 Tax=Pseudoxanthomonas mexicana TaxID=128785 RepID=UPI00398ADECB
MTPTMPGTAYPRRATLLHVAAVTWVLLISTGAVVNHVTLTKLADEAEASTADTQIAALEQRLTELSQDSEQSRTRPPAVPQARYDADRQALDRRLSALEQSLGDRSADAALQTMQARIERLEARPTARPAPRPATAPGTAPTTPPKPVEPPFRVMGAELRAGERFLSILPAESSALDQARLLRPGEEEAGWRLTAIEGDIAVFQHGTETRRLTVPAR